MVGDTVEGLCGALNLWLNNEDVGRSFSKRLGLTDEEDRELRTARINALLRACHQTVAREMGA